MEKTALKSIVTEPLSNDLGLIESNLPELSIY
jgi:hypothetical protein